MFAPLLVLALLSALFVPDASAQTRAEMLTAIHNHRTEMRASDRSTVRHFDAFLREIDQVCVDFRGQRDVSDALVTVYRLLMEHDERIVSRDGGLRGISQSLLETMRKARATQEKAAGRSTIRNCQQLWALFTTRRQQGQAWAAMW